ncbi:ammonium transporter [Rhabdothermincola sp.]|uniref:ammonium transporter n=1 Tax=Rhabdothermincola sp. TaxID=2820405 RepID=UPI002FDF302F
MRAAFAPRRLAAAVAAGVILSVLFVGTAMAQDEGPVTVETVSEHVVTLTQTTNLTWIVIGAALVIFMQAGFAMVETGFCRAKHAAHVVATNFAIFGLGFVGFFLVGFGLMYGGYSYVLPGFDYGLDHAIGGSAANLIGSGQWVFLWKGGFAGSFFDGDNLAFSGAAMAFFLYMVAFMDTTATIPTGSMAERWKWKSFVWWGLFCGAIYYPLFGAWTWGGGFLSQLGNSLHWGNGYVDFAGSGVVHAVGGVAALAGAMVLGPRIGKFTKDGKPRGIPGHNIPMAMLGTFILLFGWFGFNAASTFASSDPQIGIVAANTAIAAAFGGVISMFWITRRTGKPDPAMMANGMLAGLVAITAPCAFVDPWAAAVIGAIAGVVVIEAVFFIERRLKIDDPVGAIAVHGVNGLLGVLAVGIFANGKYGAGWNLTTTFTDAEGTPKGVTGILYGSDGWGQLASQALGALVICTVIFGVAYAFFKIQNALTSGGIRSDEADEIAGLDLPEMGVVAYPEFAGAGDSYSSPDASVSAGSSRAPTSAG